MNCIPFFIFLDVNDTSFISNFFVCFHSHDFLKMNPFTFSSYVSEAKSNSQSGAGTDDAILSERTSNTTTIASSYNIPQRNEDDSMIDDAFLTITFNDNRCYNKTNGWVDVATSSSIMKIIG